MELHQKSPEYSNILAMWDNWDIALHPNEISSTYSSIKDLELMIPKIKATTDGISHVQGQIPMTTIGGNGNKPNSTMAFAHSYGEGTEDAGEESLQAENLPGHQEYKKQSYSAPNLSQMNFQSTYGVSLLETQVEGAWQPLELSRSFGANTFSPSPTSTHSPSPQNIFDGDSCPSKQEMGIVQLFSNSTTSGEGTQSPIRRNSENNKPLSARVTDLKKNREAARRCRSKQKRQQEELCVTARDIQRKNKQLKTEIKFLEIQMRSLVEMAGQHSNCSDQRINVYLQRRHVAS